MAMPAEIPHPTSAPIGPAQSNPTSRATTVQRQLLLPVATIRIAGLGPARRDDAVGIERRRSPGALFHCH